MKKSLISLAVIGVTPAVLAGPTGRNPHAVGVRPIAVQTYADAYNLGTGHYLFGTSDPNGTSCFPASSCPAGSTQISRAAYIGSIEDPNGANNNFNNANGNDMVTLLVFDAAQIPFKGKNCSLVFSNIQNFTGQAYRLAAKVMETRGDNLVDPGVEGVFRDRGPFGIPLAGALSTVVNDARSERGFNGGAKSVAANGPLVAHPADPAFPYLTFDRSAVVKLGDIRDQVQEALDSGITYTTCRHSCIGATLDRNVDCDLPVSNPLYIGVTGQRGGGDRGSERLQDSLAVDNIVHIHGDCDFAGESAPAESTFVELLCIPPDADNH
jgi:hypothetical protein